MNRFALTIGLSLLISIIVGAPAWAHEIQAPHDHPHTDDANAHSEPQVPDPNNANPQGPYINIGSLDIEPLNSDGTSNGEWFIEHLKPGEQMQKMLRVSNFSPLHKHISLYVTDEINSAKTANNNTATNSTFFVKNIEENPDYLNKWIKLPAKELTLNPGETKILSVNFRLPKNAGVGLHKGAIIARELISSTSSDITNLATEKGIRIYLNVKGPIVTRGETTQVQTAQSLSEITIQAKTYNSGTTDFSQNYTATLKNILTGEEVTAENNSITKPQTETTATINIQKPTFGIYTLTLSGNNTPATSLGNIIFIPFWIPFTIVIFTLLVIARQLAINLNHNKKSTKTVIINCIEEILNYGNSSIETFFRHYIRLPETKRGATYLIILALCLSIFANIVSLDIRDIQAHELANTQHKHYNLTVKWGNFRKQALPDSYTKEWHGRIVFTNANIITTEYLHFERTDQAEIVGNNSSLRFDTFTGPDNDGLIIKLSASNENTPIVKYENFDTKEQFEFKITDLLNTSKILPNGLFSTEISVDQGDMEQLYAKSMELISIGETPGTMEVEATPPVGLQIPELQNLFIEELPATPSALTDFIFSSDYINNINRQNSTAKLDTSPILIKALEATPEIINEISATPDLNFIFVPTEPISFPPQEFSFTEKRITIQNLGAIIFVHNKKSPWNTYVGTSNFQLLSGKQEIPASSLTVTPGDAIILTDKVKDSRDEKNKEKTNSKIKTGEKRKFVGTYDKTPLVEVAPEANGKQIFILNPRLEIVIPEGTPAGTYRGTLTITSL